MTDDGDEMRKSGKIRRETAIAAVLLCGITASMARHPLAHAAAPVAKMSDPIITRIVARHYTVVVAAGPDAALYTITGENGQRLADHITLAAMKQSNPDLFRQIAPALAMGDADAAIDTSAGE